MRNWIIEKLGGITEENHREAVETHSRMCKKIEVELSGARARLAAAEIQLKRQIPVVDIGLLDPEPTDTEERQGYVARVSGDFEDYLRPKIHKIISEVREMLDSPNRTHVEFGIARENYDWFLRGTSNFGKLLLDWGDQLRSEHLANLKEKEEPNT